MKNKINYNPDVLDALANLSNDEVFTPPKVVNNILDILPEELWSDKNATFLDPACKSGVFLREIAKRLIKGLEKEIPNKQERLNHIYTKQLFGIAITELTALLSRRTLYCSKIANGKYSVCTGFKNKDGNIDFEIIKHTWEGKKCKYCGASKEEYDREEGLETHAYKFIHNYNTNMKFDVIIGNPPYQLNVGNTVGNSSKAKAIYHQFVEQAIKLQPRYLTMIIPSRWMTKSTEGISDKWVDKMINENKIKVLNDYLDSKICFPGVSIEGGVCYFLWSKNYEGKCSYVLNKNIDDFTSKNDYLNALNVGIVIRDIQAMSILNKIKNIEKNYINNNEKNFSFFVSPKDFFTNKTKLTSSWDKYKKRSTKLNNIKYYLNKNIHKIDFAWIQIGDIPKNIESSKLHKVFIPAARGGSVNESNLILGKPFYGEPGSVCSQTYLVIGYNPIKHNLSKKECENIISYIKTKFFRYLVSIKKKTQNGPRSVYQLVPIQDFSESWTDEKLYKKYKLTQEEIEFIESMIRPMD